MAIGRKIGQLAYGAMFTLVLPCLWCFWAWRLDRSALSLWPIPVPGWLGVLLLIAGLAFMLVSMGALWVTGKGLPMNAYPPSRFVDTGPYALFEHPIYLGFVVAVTGAAIAAKSPAGFWIVAPISALSVVALVVGYEGPRLKARFGDASNHAAILGLPRLGQTHVPLSTRVAAAAITLGPWAIAYSLLSRLPAPGGVPDLRMAWEHGIATHNWAVWPYSAAYPIAIVAPLLLGTSTSLRRFVIAGWLIAMLGFTTMLLIPGRADLLPITGSAVELSLLNANRALDANWLALPSFHVAWTVLAGYCLVVFRRSLRPVALLTVVGISLSCVFTGSHAVIDVAAGLMLGVLGWHHRQAWQALVRWSERLANSWAAIELGPVRIINHAIWSGLAAFAGMLVVVVLTGPDLLVETSGIFLAGLLSAGAWGYWLEGGSRLSRPFGYYGFLFGGLGAILFLAFIQPETAAKLTAAFACGAPLSQAIGRLRCLVQGCCHGRPITGLPGIRVVNAKSRVTALSELHGVPLHPTQLYSVIGNLLIFACLLRLHLSGATATFIGGLYLVLSSLARFAEEQYRGEPQTPRIFDLAVYQWLAIATFLLGILITLLDSAPVSAATVRLNIALLIPLGAGIIAAAFMSVDFPKSRRRFSRLTVGETG